jgi:hypothetical protein
VLAGYCLGVDVASLIVFFSKKWRKFSSKSQNFHGFFSFPERKKNLQVEIFFGIFFEDTEIFSEILKIGN